MKISFFNPFLISLSLFLLVYAIGLMPFTNALAAGISFGILSTIIYPKLRGVRKGDLVSIISPSLKSHPNIFQFILGPLLTTTATAMKNGKKGDIIDIVLEDGSERKAIILNYAGIFSLAEVKLVKPPKVISPSAEVQIY